MLVGGVLSDRISPRDLALVSNVVRATLTTIVAALVLGAQVELWQLALVGVVFGTVDAIFLPAINTLVPRLVPADRLAPANAVMQGTAQLVGTVGPAIAGFAVALIGVGAAFAIDALSFAVAAGALWLVRSGARPGPPVDPDAHDPAATLVDRSGLRRRRRSPVAGRRPRRRCARGARRPCHALDRHRLDGDQPGLHRADAWSASRGSSWSISVRTPSRWASCSRRSAPGSLGGVLVAGSTRHPRHFGSIVLGLVLAMGLGLAAVGLAPSLPIVGVIALCVGAMNGYVGVVVIAWVQGRTDPAMLGRTMSFMMLGSVVAAPLSLALAAVVVDTHAGAMFVAAGLLVVGSGIVAFASGLQRRMV